MEAQRFLVAGRVQGVWFRASAQRRARELGLDGHARNLADGSVEVVAAGEAGALEQLADWLQRGPPLAEVESVTRSPWPDPVPAGFHTA